MQLAHDDEPPALYVPAVHGAQLVAPMGGAEAALVPAAHETQTLAPDEDT